jgi:hypothetical protein
VGDFVIPTNLSDLTEEAIRRHRTQAAEAFNTALSLAREANESGTLSGEQLDQLEALRAFVSEADAALTSLSPAEPAEPTDPAGPSGQDSERLGALAPVELAPEPVRPAPTVADVASGSLVTAAATAAVNSITSRSAITASAGLTGYTAGQPLDSLDALADALAPRLSSYLGLGQGVVSKDPVATITLPPSEFSVHGDRRDIEIVNRLVDESRLPGGSLVEARYQAFQALGSPDALAVTASGWCAPSETDYSANFYGAAAGLYDTPTVPASRGGLWIMPEIPFASVYGMAPAPGANFFNLTEDQVIAGNTKTFVEVDCPTPAEYRLGVTGFGLVAGLMQLRAYPEYVREFTRASLIALQQYRSAINVAAVVALSTAVDLTAVLPWSADGTVLSNCLSAAEMAAVDQRYRGRLATNATIEQVWPVWLFAQMRADYIRRNGIGTDPVIADAWVMSWFRDRYIAPQWVYGWQDRFGSDGGAGYPGSTPPITAFPLTVKFLSYPAGTWVAGTADVIQLSTIYDSVRLASNERIEFFTEQGNRMIPRRSDSRVYTVPVCPNGATANQRAITCTSG